jgi:hypothetical protein
VQEFGTFGHENLGKRTADFFVALVSSIYGTENK